MRFFTLVLRSVMRRRMRSALTVIGIAIAVAAVVALIGISRQSAKSFLSIYQRQQVSLVVLRAGTAQRLTSALSQTLGPKIQKLPGVKRVYSGLIDMMSLPQLGPVGVLVQGWPPDAPQFMDLKVLSGRALTPGDTHGIMLGKTLAENLGLKVGDPIKLYETEEFRLAGVFQSYTVFENGGMIVLLASLQRLMGREGQVTGFTVVVDDPTNRTAVEQVRREILALDQGVDAFPTEDYVRTTSEIRLIRGMAWLVSVVALLIGTIGILNTMIMSVFERTREIGILRAIGWRRTRIVGMILLESLVLSIAGGGLGILAAVIMTHYLSKFRPVAGLVSGAIDLQTIGNGLLIAVLVGVVGALYPAYRGVQLPPTEAIRHD
jgi:putative ABC transport system permease protein